MKSVSVFPPFPPRALCKDGLYNGGEERETEICSTSFSPLVCCSVKFSVSPLSLVTRVYQLAPLRFPPDECAFVFTSVSLRTLQLSEAPSGFTSSPCPHIHPTSQPIISSLSATPFPSKDTTLKFRLRFPPQRQLVSLRNKRLGNADV